MSRVPYLVALVSVCSLWACTSVLGQFTVGSSGSGEDASTEGGTQDATMGDSGSAGDSGSPSDGTTGDAPGADGAACTPNEKRCVGNGVETCTNGAWGAPVACPVADPFCSGAGVCAACSGVCQGQCTPGTTTCSTMGPQVCGSNGSWGQPTACGPHQTCTGGGSVGTAMCTCATDPTCTGQGFACENGTTLATCGQDAMGCWYPSSTATCTNGACFGTAPTAQCCTNQCTLAATRCGGAGLETCTAQGNGCTAWNAGTACGAHQTCTTTGSTSSCTCVADAYCTSTADACSSGTTYVVCGQDADGCYYELGSMTCQANSTCTGGTCQCKSGYTPCSGSCVDVNTDSSNCGSCGHVCPVLTSPSSGSTCGLVSAGHCAGYVGGYVPVAGTLASNPDGATVAVVKATMPSVAGTFVGVGALVGSTDTSGSTQMIFGLFDDVGGLPSKNLFLTSVPDTGLTFNDPSGLMRLQSSGGSYLNGFNNALAPNTTYWAYMKAGTNSSTHDTAGKSTAKCYSMSWINDAPPGTFSSTPSACVGDYDLYMIVSFP